MEHLFDAHFGETAGQARSIFRIGEGNPWHLTKNADTDAANPGERRVAHKRVVSGGASTSGVRADHTRPKSAAPNAGSGELGYRELEAGKGSPDRVRCEMNYGTPPCERQSYRECASLDGGIRSPDILTGRLSFVDGLVYGSSQHPRQHP